MHEIESTRFSVSFHLKDLLKRDAETVRDIAKWLETRAETKRDRANRTGSKRMMARLIAAKQLLRGLEDTPSAESVMNRTEGKVADRLISEVRAVHLHFSVTPATPATCQLPTHDQVTLPPVGVAATPPAQQIMLTSEESIDSMTSK